LSQTIPNRLNEGQKGRVHHPCHPLNGYEFEPVRLFNSLGTIRVEFFDPSGQQMALPLRCTTLAGEDPSIHFSDGQGFLRVPDLLEVSAILSWIKQQMEATCSKGT
jgi:hypothetical protein